MKIFEKKYLPNICQGEEKFANGKVWNQNWITLWNQKLNRKEPRPKRKKDVPQSTKIDGQINCALLAAL